MTAIAATGLACEVSYRDVIDGLKATALALSTTRDATRHVELLVIDDTLVITATVPDQAEIRVRIPAAGIEPGVLLVAHAQLQALLTAATKGASKRDLDTATVRIVDTAGDDDTLNVELSGYQLPIAVTRDVSSYPQAPAMPDPTVVVDRAAFTAMFTRVQPAAATDSYVPLLTGVQLHAEPNRVVLIATDRYRISRGHIDTDTTNAHHNGVLPGALTGKLLKLLDGDQLHIGTAEHNGRTWTTIATDTITAHLAAPTTGDYPRVAQLFDLNPDSTLTIDRSTLAAAATRTAAITKALASRSVGARIDVTADTLTLTPGADKGTAHAPAIPITRDGNPEPWASAANPTYLAAALTAFTTDTIEIHLGQPHKPFKLHDPDGTFDHVLMPMRLPN